MRVPREEFCAGHEQGVGSGFWVDASCHVLFRASESFVASLFMFVAVVVAVLVLLLYCLCCSLLVVLLLLQERWLGRPL